ncbi:MAG TPA: hypothetical protein VKB49_31900 [Candidatus Sulfotelmatobacter sp.]|nr:hypothetical protein [Candidatus Sulfotelmatobacter sp.]
MGKVNALTPRQQALTTLEQAWLFYLPNHEPPNLPRVCGWLRTASLRRILSLIEEVSQLEHVQSADG